MTIMTIAFKEQLMTRIVLGTIVLIAVMIGFTYVEVTAANIERRQVGEIARGLSQLRVLTFEYRLYHNARAKAQWYALSDRVDLLLANGRTSIPSQHLILADMQDKRA